MTPGYGIRWPDGTYTGAITATRSLAADYARTNNGSVYTVGSSDDPETKSAPAPVNIWRAP